MIFSTPIFTTNCYSKLRSLEKCIYKLDSLDLVESGPQVLAARVFPKKINPPTSA